MINELLKDPAFAALYKNAPHLNDIKEEKTSVTVEKKRHIAKTISYRVISTLIGFGVMWGISGSITVGAAFGVAEIVYKPLQYYIHERIWYKYITYGLKNKK